MQIVLHEDMDLLKSAGMKIWMLGYTEASTRILNPVEVFLYIEKNRNPAKKQLSLVSISLDGDITNTVEIEENDQGIDDGTTIFLANTKEELFEIERVVLIRSTFKHDLLKAKEHRQLHNLGLESLFFDHDTTWNKC